MRHHILVKWKEGCKPGLEPIRELFQETLAIPGVESVELHPNVPITAGRKFTAG